MQGWVQSTRNRELVDPAVGSPCSAGTGAMSRGSRESRGSMGSGITGGSGRTVWTTASRTQSLHAIASAQRNLEDLDSRLEERELAMQRELELLRQKREVRQHEVEMMQRAVRMHDEAAQLWATAGGEEVGSGGSMWEQFVADCAAVGDGQGGVDEV